MTKSWVELEKKNDEKLGDIVLDTITTLRELTRGDNEPFRCDRVEEILTSFNNEICRILDKERNCCDFCSEKGVTLFPCEKCGEYLCGNCICLSTMMCSDCIEKEIKHKEDLKILPKYTKVQVSHTDTWEDGTYVNAYFFAYRNDKYAVYRSNDEFLNETKSPLIFPYYRIYEGEK